jgi:hypothetical protein
MHVIHHRHQQRVKPSSSYRRWLRPALWISLGIIGVFLLANLIMGLWYRSRVLPNYSLGAVAVGNRPFDKLDDTVSLDTLLPKDMVLTKDDKTRTSSPQTLGVTIDWPASRENLKKARSWLPVMSLFGKRTVPVALKFNEAVFTSAAAQLAPSFAKEALPERIVFTGSEFAVAAPEAGYQLDTGQFKAQLLAALERGKAELNVPTKSIASDKPSGGLESQRANLQKQLARKITYSLGGQTKQPGASDIGQWFVASDQTMVLSEEKIKAYVQTLGPSLYNTTDAAAASSYGLSTGQDLTFVLGSSQTPARYSYCAAVRGVNTAELPGFKVKVAATLGDPRGWNAGGKISFARVDSGCDFTIWLSAPSQMTSFGGVCDSYYSCRSGRNVVINFDRWKGATPPWNAAGGSLEDYRVMVINHEVGHWLGFGHLNCPGPGQPAPVMQQQSISLQGCTFNPWPTAGELTTAKQVRGIAALPAREDFVAAASCSCGHCTA